ncbi:L-rhamnose isomerase [Lactiplantibacillus plantarum subsp. plantarum]|uniref:L-rhamnose isomerase n=1 Tax=Lactiplantibacillus plantarum subsp. plantarum TaxID=337330 RepID=A0A2S3UA01_LACPN|nr:L-rhamnose isomerase [Lactiplantibacillus plantarum subsp. plantarum]
MGLAFSGDYPGIARTPDQLTGDLHEALSLIPGSHKVLCILCIAVTDKKKDFNEVGPEDFKYWVDWAKQEGIGLDMNPTFFSHPMVKHNFTLASPEKSVRDYWIEVGKKSREIANLLWSRTGTNNQLTTSGFQMVSRITN